MGFTAHRIATTVSPCRRAKIVRYLHAHAYKHTQTIPRINLEGVSVSH